MSLEHNPADRAIDQLCDFLRRMMLGQELELKNVLIRPSPSHLSLP
jgi:hypothetical protein